MQETYRNHYCLCSHGTSAAEMRQSPWWREGKTTNHGRTVFFHVTDAGRRALALHLTALSRLPAKCVSCGRFIALRDVEVGRAQYRFTPDNAFGAERTVWLCAHCNLDAKVIGDAT